MSYYRIKALIIYHIYTLRSSLTRLIFMFVLPIFDFFLWFYLTIYLRSGRILSSSLHGFILGAFIIWQLVARMQQEASGPLMDDLNSQNLNNILTSPVTLGEILIAIFLGSLIKLGMLAVIFYALINLLYTFNILNLIKVDILMLLFFINLLIFGWNMGLVSIGFVVRFGYRADAVAWTLAMLAQPFSCVFYPRQTLPYFFNKVSYLSPGSYVFEGLRTLIIDNSSHALWKQLFWASILNIAYLVLGYFFIIVMIKWAKKKGSLVRV